MDKEMEEIMKEIEESLAIATSSKREQWALIPDEQAQFPQHARAVIDFVSG